MTALRRATLDDVPALQALITRSGLELSAPFYTPEQAEALTRHVFGVDTQLIEDGTYFLIEVGGELAACGGWSQRRTLYGGDQMKDGPDPLLDPATDAARIRAFFVAPHMARRGLGRQLVDVCLQEARAHGFTTIELGATLPGEPLYRASGFRAFERTEVVLPGEVSVPLVRMGRDL